MTATPQESAAARRYRIERYLTEGGMGAIYVGKKLGPGGFEKEVVLKQLLPEYTSRPEFRDLFFREAKISGTLDHANIVHTFDLVESEESLFIVMEYVRGIDLRSIIRRAKLRRRELAPAAALHIGLEVLSGLAYAHARKTPSGESMAIIHRDVSPSNILCSAQGEVKLSDFGIAKAATHSSVFYRVRGKVGYMSPEQARSKAIDHRTDLYSLAVCLYEALTLERLFVGDLSTPADVIYNQPIVPPSKKRKGLPGALDVVLATALSENPGDRYQDAVAFAEALRQVGHRHGLLFSAPQLGDHLRFILGKDPSTWLSDERPAASADPSTQKIPAKELEGKEASSIGVVIEGSNLYVADGANVVSPMTVDPRGAKPDLRSKLGLPPADDEFGDISDDPTKLGDPREASGRSDPSDEDGEEITRRQKDPEATAAEAFISLDEDDDDAPTRIRDPQFTPPPEAGPKRRTTIPPPPPAHALAGGLPPESPFDEFPPTPSPMFDGIEESGPPGFAAPAPPLNGPSAFAPPSFQASHAPPPIPGFSSMFPAPPLAPPPALPPPGRMAGLPRPGGYLDPGYAANLHMPPSPPQSSFEGGGGGFDFAAPETVDFGRDSVPVSVARRSSGPPGIVMLIVGLAAAAGGAKLGEIVTRNDVAALEAVTKAAPAPAAAPSTSPAPVVVPKKK
jgi:eukaryotic-like serine/threonine-protein kinase